MESTNTIEIELSKSKLTLLLLGSGIFVCIGIWLVTSPVKTDLPILGNRIFHFIVGFSGILFFGFAGFISIKKMQDKSPGLIISSEGITDNSGGISVGFIPWSDVVEVKERKVFNQVFVQVLVKNPKEYIEKQKNAFKRKTLQVNYNSYGSVIGISANGLKCNYGEIKSILDKKFAEYKSKTA